MAVDLAKSEAAMEKYVKSGKELLAKIVAKKVTDKEADEAVKNMVDAAVVLIKEYAAKDPKAEKLVSYLIKSLPDLQKASFADLQKDWHDAGKLTEKEVGIDLKKPENDKYLDPSHTLLHPLMTLRAVKDKKLNEAKEELTEGLEQVKLTLKELKK
jgi:hypothetical protein